MNVPVGYSSTTFTTGRHSWLLALADIGVFRRRILRSIYRLAVSQLCHDQFPTDPVWISLNGKPPVRVTSCDGDFVE